MSSLLMFNRVYRLEIQSVMLVFFDPSCELAPFYVTFSLWFTSPRRKTEGKNRDLYLDRFRSVPNPISRDQIFHFQWKKNRDLYLDFSKFAVWPWLTSNSGGSALQRHNTKTSKQMFPEKELRCLSLWAIYKYSHDQSAYSAAGKYVSQL